MMEEMRGAAAGADSVTEEDDDDWASCATELVDLEDPLRGGGIGAPLRHEEDDDTEVEDGQLGDDDEAEVEDNEDAEEDGQEDGEGVDGEDAGGAEPAPKRRKLSAPLASQQLPAARQLAPMVTKAWARYYRDGGGARTKVVVRCDQVTSGRRCVDGCTAEVVCDGYAPDQLSRGLTTVIENHRLRAVDQASTAGSEPSGRTPREWTRYFIKGGGVGKEVRLRCDQFHCQLPCVPGCKEVIAFHGYAPSITKLEPILRGLIDKHRIKAVAKFRAGGATM